MSISWQKQIRLRPANCLTVLLSQVCSSIKDNGSLHLPGSVLKPRHADRHYGAPHLSCLSARYSLLSLLQACQAMQGRSSSLADSFRYFIYLARSLMEARDRQQVWANAPPAPTGQDLATYV